MTARYVVVDLDTLVASVKQLVVTHPTAFRDVLERVAVADIAVDVVCLAALLDDDDDDDNVHAKTTTVYRCGSYYKPSVPYGGALAALGWDMKKKGAAHHCTLENLLKQALRTADTTVTAHEHPVLVLATGVLTQSVVQTLARMLAANWRVELVCLQHCAQTADVQQLRGVYATQLTSVSLDPHVRDLVVNSEQLLINRSSSGSRYQQTLSVAHQQLTFDQASGPHSESLPTVSDSVQKQPLRNTRTDRLSPAALEQRIVRKKRLDLQTTPSAYTADATRPRFVLMDFDNVTAGLHSSHRLFERVAGARSGHDLLMNLQALTTRIVGSDAASVAKQLATYFCSSRATAFALKTQSWSVLKQETVSDMTLQLELLETLVASTDGVVAASSAAAKTLVLVTGDGNVPPNGKPFPAIVQQYLRQGWHVEVHAWLHATSDSYLKLQRAFPTRLVVRPLDDAFDAIVSLRPTARGSARADTQSDGTDGRLSGAAMAPLRMMARSGCGSDVAPLLAPQHRQKLFDAFLALRVAAVERGELPPSVLDAPRVCVLQDESTSGASDPLAEPDGERLTLGGDSSDDADADEDATTYVSSP